MAASDDPIYSIGDTRITDISEEWTEVDLVSPVGRSMAGLLIAVVDLMGKGNRAAFDAFGS